MPASHNLLLDYINRFKSKSQNHLSRYSDFFTQLDIDNYAQQLPYIFDIENFCLRLIQAYLSNQKICVYADFDTDAVTATAVMYHGLIDLGYRQANLSFYTPDRFTEGYGINAQAINSLATKFDLIISVDCGINSVIEAEQVQNTNCDLIITDHHHLSGVVPQCTAVCNPRLSDHYLQKPQDISSLKKRTDSLIAELTPLFSNEQLEKCHQWVSKLYNRSSVSSNLPQEQNFLSSSVTGVGVAWFCLVWLAYALDELNIS